ncbi:MAG: hypothetical protein SCARUB_04565 [Candidatus Scalindua rubra]|uniref:Uncharacterized protein n=1 Tax=Candidatus Scalindua rubra TaxID=1872076 RepID=A0A1E3X3Z4_9BACT|nr:MAG: hypothetical protein SCARUB_04565 [Candidatus Scalindua rubra]
MKKVLFIQALFVPFLLIAFETTSYGAGKFKQHYNKGIEFYKQGKYDQAGKEFEKAIELKPNDVYALYGLGNTYYCKAKYDDAVKIYTRAININPDYAKVHYSLSLAYSKLGMTSEAEKQKTIFRKLSKGKKDRTRATSSRISRQIRKTVKVDSTPKKTLSQKKSVEVKTKPKKKVLTRTPSKHQKTKHRKKTVYESHKIPATRRSTNKGDSHSIFKDYSGETRKADKRVFTKKYEGFSKNPFNGIKLFIQDKWYTSGINKIWICTAGYIFATQLWLCVVAFFCVIVWRIREKA